PKEACCGRQFSSFRLIPGIRRNSDSWYFCREKGQQHLLLPFKNIHDVEVLFVSYLSRMLCCKVLAVQTVVVAALWEPLQVFSFLHNFTVSDYQDQIRLPDGTEAVGDEEGGAAPKKVVNGSLDQLLCLGIDGGGGLI